MELNKTANSSNGYYSGLFADYPEGLATFAAICCVLFMLIGIPGNLITILALSTYKKIRNATAIFIINLSLCDLVYCCFNLPLAASTFFSKSWPHGDTLCRLFPMARFGLAAVSLFTILAITTNRYIMISHPRLYPKLYKPRNLAFIIVSIWLFSFGCLIPTWFELWGTFGMDPATGYCSMLRDENGNTPENLLFLLAFIIPFITIMICYTRIFWVVRKTMKNSGNATNRQRRTTVIEDSSMCTSNSIERGQESDNDSDNPSSPGHPRIVSLRGDPPSLATSSSGDVSTSLERFKSIRTTMFLKKRPTSDPSLPTSKDKKLLTMITVIVLTFCVCYLPVTVMRVIHTLTSHHPVLFVFSYLVRYLTTCINPIIYVVMSNEYRKAYKKLMKPPPCGEVFLCRNWR